MLFCLWAIQAFPKINGILIIHMCKCSYFLIKKVKKKKRKKENHSFCQAVLDSIVLMLFFNDFLNGPNDLLIHRENNRNT